tara:strand:+ start:7049 stop:7831 length:783 start_codon:yes stop_codon:yes gene_type:complete
MSDYSKLQEENKKLEEKNNGFKAVRQGFIEARKEAKDWTNGNIKWRDEEIQKLKEENEELQQELQQEKDGREHDVQQFQSVLDEKGQLEAEVEELQEVESLLQPFQNTETFHMKVEEMIKENKLIKDEAKMFGKAFKKIEEENKKLKEEVVTFPEKLKLVRANASLEFVVKLNEAVADLQILAEKAEIKKLKEDLERMKRWTDRALRDNEELKEEKEILCKFLGGNYDEGSAVEEILKGYYSEDFIKANKETWDYYQIFQ